MISCLESVKLDWDGMRKGCIRKDWYASLKRVSIVQIVVLKTEALYLCAWHVFLFVFVFNQLSNTFSLFLIYNTVASFFFFFFCRKCYFFSTSGSVGSATDINLLLWELANHITLSNGDQWLDREWAYEQVSQSGTFPRILNTSKEVLGKEAFTFLWDY